MISIRVRLVLFFLLLAGSGYFILVRHWTKSIRPAHLRSLEATMIDTATVLAALVSAESSDGKLDLTVLHATLAGTAERRFEARVYELVKTRVDMRTYVTDAQGTVVYDSATPSEVGLDYRNWNDVLRTLRGGYGARSTRLDPDDPRSSTIYVAAPILHNDQIIGSLSVGKEITNLSLFIDTAKKNLVNTTWLVALIVVSLAILVTIRVTGPIRKLTAYAQAVGRGERPPVPQVKRGEMQTLAKAFEDMRDELEGKKYVESYVENLTHEMKSPLTAIRANAEMLQEADLPATQRQAFLDNVTSETERLRTIVDRLLQLAEVESRKQLDAPVPVSVEGAISEAAATVALGDRSLILPTSAASVCGDAFLLRQALANLLQNAVDFTAPNGRILVAVEDLGEAVCLSVTDDGPGLPDYAVARATERFFSLPRPDSGRKSSGLGLAFVAEVAALHGGDFTIANGREGGAVAKLTIRK